MATRRLMVLSEADKRLIEEFISKSRTLALNAAGRPRVNREVSPAPEVYVARTPPGGIPAIVGDNPGAAECEVYHAILSGDTATLTSIGLTLFVLNLGGAVDGSIYVLIERDKAGSWYAVGNVTLIEDVETGTGTGTDTTLEILAVEDVDQSPSYSGINRLQFDQADGFVISNPSAGVARIDLAEPCGTPYFYTYRYRCQAGNLNEYRQTIDISYDSDRCIKTTIGPERFVRTVACCDETCIDWTGTASGTFGTSTGTPLHLCCSVGRICVTLYNLENASFLNGLSIQLDYDLGVGYWRGWSDAIANCPDNGEFRSWYIGFTVDCDPDTGLWYYSYSIEVTPIGDAPPPLSSLPDPKQPLAVTCDPFRGEKVGDFGYSCIGSRTSIRAVFTEGECTTTGTGTGDGTVTVACCANGIPTTLVLTPVITGNVDCPMGSVTLTYNSGTGRWEGTYAGSAMTVYCDGSDWRVTGCGIGEPGSPPVSAPACDPLFITFIGAIPSCCSATQIQWVVTEP